MKRGFFLHLTLASFMTLTVLLSRQQGVEALDFVFHNADELEIFLRNISETYPDITRLYSIGKSVNGTNLWVIAIGESPRDHVLLRPNVKYVGNQHGNEMVGREELLHFIDYLVTHYKQLDNVTHLLQTSTIHILPSMNPDGFALAMNDYQCNNGPGRDNLNGIDLNRNFPDFFREPTSEIQPETRAVIDWLKSTQFTLSGNVHGGAVLVNYPYDNYLGKSTASIPSIAPDDDVYIYLAQQYANTHPYMTIVGNCPLYNITDGITNGADWYPLTGGMQDYNYIFAGCMDVTLELSCCEFPTASELQMLWEANRDSLLLYLMQVNMGVRGLVKDERDNPVEGAVVSIQGREVITSNTTRHGEYWRLLLPGHYRLLVSLSGCNPKIVPFEVVNGTITRLDVTIERGSKGESKGVTLEYSSPLLVLQVMAILLLFFI